MSRIGKKPVDLPAGVTASCPARLSKSKAQRGHVRFKATDDVTITIERALSQSHHAANPSAHASSGA